MKVSFQREPALWLGALAAALNLATGFGLPVSTVQTGLINAGVAAALALAAAWAVRPFPVPLLVGAVNGALALGIGFGLHVTSGQVGLIDARRCRLLQPSPGAPRLAAVTTRVEGHR
jgi:hypothetical protein